MRALAIVALLALVLVLPVASADPLSKLGGADTLALDGAGCVRFDPPNLPEPCGPPSPAMYAA